PVAALGDVARPRRRAADVGLLQVRAAGSGRAGAGLRGIADAGGRATLGPGGLEAVGRARVVRAVAALVGVARGRRGAADVGLLGIGRAGGAGTGAQLRGVADTGRRPTHRGGRLEAVDGARVVRPVAALGHVARARRQAADTGPLGVGRTGGTGPGAELGRVALACGRAAGGGRRLEAVRRTVAVRPAAALGHVARARRGTADPRPLFAGGTRGSRPGADLRHVAGARRRA